MGASMISVGLTMDRTRVQEVVAQEQNLNPLLTVLTAGLSDKLLADFAEQHEFDEGQDVDDWRLALWERCENALRFLAKHDDELQDIAFAASIPGSERMGFYVFGQPTWGDSPFDEFDDVCILLTAIEELKRKHGKTWVAQVSGIRGGGIVL